MHFIIALFLVGADFVSAQSVTLPELSGESKVGRVTLYKSTLGTSWLVPTAFSASLRCSSANHDSLCTLSVVNALTVSEQQAINDLMVNENLRVTYFTDIETNIVSNIKGEFKDLPSTIDGKPLVLNTLQMSNGKIPYASIAFRAQDPRNLAYQFDSTGLGQFSVSFLMHARQTYEYLGFHNGDCVKGELLENKGAYLWSRSLKKLVQRIASKCDFRFIGYDPDDAAASVAVYFRENLFNSSWRGYQVNEAKVNEISDRLVVYEAAFNRVMNCSSSIELKSEAQPQLTCEELK